MDASPQAQAKTRMFARVLGPFLVIIDITAVGRASDMQTVLSDFEASPLWSWVAGAFILAFGLVIVAAHQYWKGAAAIIVSLTGWLITLRGLLLFAFPKAFATVANSMIGAQGWWIALCVAFALVGLYLTYVGWVPVPRRPEPQAVSADPHLPRAA
ncbi:hypothetical protein BN1232_00051 [Mycobacterium lentiflavum]|uniref:Transmembrane protein n=1 Tax=Mycobacterium lentiflavum TaxID=141349 RepID=A0A0E4GUG0_MYCLN|nr:hypothetical protein [Mycobacterium lentiflavum]MEE3065833.1 hypothetical protein [Actinomycetota bacterium]ULP42345.1 hypothetical protein MJO58_26820 [Mycobacterium lentiflavum]CQD02252.1 hypothetical protein BN1232_00051 [Mycobacterium lentiflavum]